MMSEIVRTSGPRAIAGSEGVLINLPSWQKVVGKGLNRVRW